MIDSANLFTEIDKIRKLIHKYNKARIHRIRKSQFDFNGINNAVAVLTNPFYFVRKNLFKNIQEFSSLFDGKVLDFGCGAKPYKDLFKKCSEYIGCDIATSGHDHINEQIDVFYNGETIPFEDGYFDNIFTSEVFEHVFNLDTILDELYRVLKPGGYMLATVPFIWNEHEIPFDYGRYTSYGIQSLLKRHGFKIVQLKKSTNYIEMIYQLKMEYVRYEIFKVGNPTIRHFLQRILIAPLAIMGSIMQLILPENQSFYGDNIVLCKK